MSDSQQRPWSNSPNAPKIPYDLYFREKAYFSGTFIGAMLYGTPKVPPPIHPSIRAHSVYSVQSRDRRHAFLQMYDGTTQPNPS